jgi:Spy/CpxP family protein refolding chaperone
VRAMMARVMLAGVLAATVVCAQGKRSPGGGNSMGNIPISAGPQSRMDMMESILKLNKDQKKQVKTIMDDAQKEAAPVRDQIAKSEQDLGEAVAAGKRQEEIDKASGGLGGLEAQMAGVEMKAFAKIYQTLDKDQQQNAGRVFFMMQGIFSGKNWNEARP